MMLLPGNLCLDTVKLLLYNVIHSQETSANAGY